MTMASRPFPKNKYHFSKYLVDVGDYLVTEPITPRKKAKLFAQAAYFWAWNHRKVIKTNIQPNVDNTWTVTVTLVSKHRKRDYE